MSPPTLKERMRGGLWGSLVGDALGVPVEFLSREEVQRDPVVGMRGYGTHHQPAGTWSDDSSLLLCSTESFAERRHLDTSDMAGRFVRWRRDGHWTPHGRVFDIGIATSHAISRMEAGTPPEAAGATDECSNGNGSLMRILPVVLWYHDWRCGDALDAVHPASALTHGHPRSQMACGLYAMIARELLWGASPKEALSSALRHFNAVYGYSEPFAAERRHFHQLVDGRLPSLPECEVRSSGYVMHTLVASVWCLQTSDSFEETVLKAVNLGGDTDTTGCVAGGLAGIAYGHHAVPATWIDALARKQDIAGLFDSFLTALAPQPEP